MPEVKTYIGCKIIKAYQLTKKQFDEMKDRPTADSEKDQDGYCVEYPDGYTSWSPKSVFEQAYREISDSEKNLI